MPDPEKGPLERRIGRTWLEATNSGEVDMAETAYWFTEPAGAALLQKLLRRVWGVLGQGFLGGI